MEQIPGFRQVPRTGVIFVMHEAGKKGFVYGSKEWANLGQGSPETGDLPGARERIRELAVDPSQHSYGPVEGVLALRQQVADFYINSIAVERRASTAIRTFLWPVVEELL
jgi:aspartate/methionine/tyrosine aminotransferase